MRHIKFANQLIRLEGTSDKLDPTTVAKSVNAAINFCKENELDKCELDYNGFLFVIEPNSDLNGKLNEYDYAQYLKG